MLLLMLLLILLITVFFTLKVALDVAHISDVDVAINFGLDA
jgi:hypothetical protein